MLRFLSKPTIMWCSLIAMLLMFVIAMFIVNPAIDGKDGSSILKLQLAFDKQTGLAIIESWGAEGRALYNRWAFTDYLYAASYAFFLASLLANLAVRSHKAGSLMFSITPLIALSAGAFDWLENLMEANFIHHPVEFSSALFFFHSIISLCKWAAIIISLLTIFILALNCLIQATCAPPETD